MHFCQSVLWLIGLCYNDAMKKVMSDKKNWLIMALIFLLGLSIFTLIIVIVIFSRAEVSWNNCLFLKPLVEESAATRPDDTQVSVTIAPTPEMLEPGLYGVELKPFNPILYKPAGWSIFHGDAGGVSITALIEEETQSVVKIRYQIPLKEDSFEAIDFNNQQALLDWLLVRGYGNPQGELMIDGLVFSYRARTDANGEVWRTYYHFYDQAESPLMIFIDIPQDAIEQTKPIIESINFDSTPQEFAEAARIPQ